MLRAAFPLISFCTQKVQTGSIKLLLYNFCTQTCSQDVGEIDTLGFYANFLAPMRNELRIKVQKAACKMLVNLTPADNLFSILSQAASSFVEFDK
jgi:hypothetical protein